MMHRNKFYLLVIITIAWQFSVKSSFAQSCDGADLIFPPLSGNTVLANGDICANSAVIPYRWNITYTNVDDNGNSANVEFIIDWDDGFIQTITNGAGDNFLQNTGVNAYSATVTHMFPVTGRNVLCEYIPTVSLQVAGTTCASTAQNPAPVVRWNTDKEIPGNLELSEQALGVVVYDICAGDTQTLRFVDNSVFNCIPANFPGFPQNTQTRWFQFDYGTPTNTITGTGVSVDTDTGTNPDNNGIQVLTTGNSYISQVVEQVGPIENPTEITFDITIAADAQVNEEFQITLNNWNNCNPYQIAGVPTGNLPVTTTAIIRIINSPPAPSDPSAKFCQFDPINITSIGSGGVITWYSDVTLMNAVHTGGTFDPVNNPPPADQLDNTIPNSKTYYATEKLGSNNCEGPATAVLVEVAEIPTTSDAGAPQTICSPTTRLNGNTPTVGTGLWSVVSGPGKVVAGDEGKWDANIEDLQTLIPSVFRWTITEGLCTSSNDILIEKDSISPSPFAGLDLSVCSSSYTLAADAAVYGIGTWTGPSGVIFTDVNDENAIVSDILLGPSTLKWTIANACGTQFDEVIITNLNPTTANVGPDQNICRNITNLPGNDPVVGNGEWTIVSNPDGNGIITDSLLYNSNFSGTEGVDYQLRWTISNGICSDSFDELTIDFAPPLPPVTINGDVESCVGDIITYTILGSDPEKYKYAWDLSGLPVSTKTLSGGTPYQFIEIEYNDPVAGGTLDVVTEDKMSLCSAPETLSITVYAIPDMILVSSDSDGILCENESVTFTANDIADVATEFEFKLNGSIVQSGTSNIYTTSSLQSNNSVSVVGVAPGRNCIGESAIPLIHPVNMLSDVVLGNNNPVICTSQNTSIALSSSVMGSTFTWDCSS